MVEHIHGKDEVIGSIPIVGSHMINYFFPIFSATVAITRLFLFYYPTPSPKIKGFQLHHYVYGIIGMSLGVFFDSIIVYAVGLGLFVDELTYIMIRGKGHEDNYSKISVVGTFVFVCLAFPFRDYLISPFI